MKAALLYGPQDFRIEELPRPEIAPDECLIRVRACGVCHSEIPQWDAKQKGLDYPSFIGHEVAGAVLAVGSKVASYRPGDRVAVWIDGKGYAEEVVVKYDRVFPVAPEIPFEFALAEPIACSTNGVRKANSQPGDVIALVGTGFMGLILLQELKLRSPKQIIAIDIRDDMLQIARQLGADIVINPQNEQPVQRIRDLTDGKGADVVFEIGGVQATLDLAADICRMEGKLVIFGFHPGPRQIKDLGYWNWMAFDIINAHFRDLSIILSGTQLGMEMLNAGKINMVPLVTHTFPLEKIETAFTAAKEKPKGFVKSVITFD